MRTPPFDESAFQFKSAFKYSKISTSDELCGETLESKQDTLQTLIRNGLIFVVYILVGLTFPLSAWFCIKRVKSLERCIVYRLGKRLPLRGPGFFLTLPCIDAIDFIDLNSLKFNVAEKEHLLTSDGSIIECNQFEFEITVDNVVKSVTQLKDSKNNVQQFVKVSFSNLIGSTHVEDLENRPDFIFKRFVENCNSYINNWGWNLSLVNLPKITVIHRAEPRNPVISALKSYFGVKDPKDAEKRAVETSVTIESSEEIDDITEPLQMIASKYSSIGMLGYDVVNVAVSIKSINQTSFYRFSSKTGKIIKIGHTENDNVGVHIIAATTDDLMDFLKSNDPSRVEIKTSLF
ncbi:stomatin-like protein 3 [Dinothrombium tinctorium]|uniref:Stomatin-like protein 3 n=1 Tax=Dinothrombium tinctorium TaxID=1965070 RepID=A0A3S4QW46_9ACAR|nr:stomatin-like protein 3 [Dinothrombium tinctorium]